MGWPVWRRRGLEKGRKGEREWREEWRQRRGHHRPIPRRQGGWAGRRRRARAGRLRGDRRPDSAEPGHREGLRKRSRGHKSGDSEKQARPSRGGGPEPRCAARASRRGRSARVHAETCCRRGQSVPRVWVHVDGGPPVGGPQVCEGDRETRKRMGLHRILESDQTCTWLWPNRMALGKNQANTSKKKDARFPPSESRTFNS